MEATEFDATKGGTENLPYSANSLKFVAARSVEIAAMTESIFRPSKTKLIFQTLPVHMRRRVMSHNCKRLPIKLREGHLEQLKKSGLPPKQKRPSRKYRRRPTNLLKEYNRRQKRNIWLETHIWHAKRFHMVERWGYKIAYRACDKAFRACYRASSKHCLLQDVSYCSPIQITGPLHLIQKMFSSATNTACGLSIGAKAYVKGSREGQIHLYQPNEYPFGYIGKASYIWVPSNSGNDNLWLFVHPSLIKEMEPFLTELLCSSKQSEEYKTANKKRKTTSSFSEDVQIRVVSNSYNRFQLTGPNSHAVLLHSLKCIDNIENIKHNQWIQNIVQNKTDLYLKEKSDYWKNLSTVNCASQLPPRIVMGLIVKDPRISRPKMRSKAKQEVNQPVDIETLINLPPSLAYSPLWDTDLQDIIIKNKMTNGQYIEHVTKTQLVPGEVNEDDPALQAVPVILIQRPGSQEVDVKRIGYCSGYNIIVPSGYGLPFWQTFVMFGARPGGLRETESLALESVECLLPPDSNAGNTEEKRAGEELRNKYFRLPPSKRVNYPKLAINSPFIYPWQMLLKDWNRINTENIFVLRDRQLLQKLQICVKGKKTLPQIENVSSCLVAIYLKLAGKGTPKPHALICLPQEKDLLSKATLYEPCHNDPNEMLRKEKRKAHKQLLKQQRKTRMKIKKKTPLAILQKKRVSHEPTEYVKKMRELWLPSEVHSVRKSCSRDVMGYVTQGAFSFTEAQGCGIGYIALTSLQTLMQSKQNQVLVRNTTSRTYRLANIQIITTCK